MKIKPYWCPLCESNRMEELQKNTVWQCKKCNILIELSGINYGEKADKDGKVFMHLSTEYKFITEKDISEEMQSMLKENRR